MKVECGQIGEDETNVPVVCAGNAEEKEQGMCEITVQLEDEQVPSSPETCSSPETDIFLFAPVSDVEGGADSDSSSVPDVNVKKEPPLPGDTNLKNVKTERPSPAAVVQKIHYVSCKSVEENVAIPKSDRKPRRKKTNSALPKQSKPTSASSNGQRFPKRQGKKKSLPNMQPDQPMEDGRRRVSGETSGWIPAPYTKPETAISPQTAMEPPGFPSLQSKMDEPFFEKKDDVLLEVLKSCQMLCTAVQRLEQKVDSLQADCSKLYLHINSKEEWHSVIQRPELKVPTLNLKQPDKRHASPFSVEGQQLWKRGQLNVGAGTEANTRCQLPKNEKMFPDSLNRPDSSQPDASLGESNKASTSRPAGRGGRRQGRGRGRSRAVSRQKEPPPCPLPPARANQPKRKTGISAPADQGPCISKVAKILSQLQERRSTAGTLVGEACEAAKNTSASANREQQVMIGSAFRKVWIPYSVYMEAFKQDEPQKAMMPVLHAVFPQSVLTCSAVVGDPQRGIQELSPNKLEAIREWLAEMYPRHELEVKGKAWAECLGVLNSLTRKLKMDTTPPSPLPQVP